MSRRSPGQSESGRYVPASTSEPVDGATSSTGGDSISPEAWAAQNPFTGTGISDTSYQQTYGVPQGYRPPSNLLLPSGQYESYSGVVSRSGQKEDFYNLDTRPLNILGAMNDVQRTQLVGILKSRGWYGDRQAGDGLTQNDVSVFRDILEYSNRRGWTWDRTVNEISGMPAVSSGRPRVQVTSKEDLTSIAKRVALETIGRTMSEKELAGFISAYQTAQRAEAYGSSEQAPQADTFFKNRIEKSYGKESDAYKHLIAISNVANLLERI